MSNIIQINNLNKSFGSVNAVQNLSFRVKKGELFAGTMIECLLYVLRYLKIRKMILNILEKQNIKNIYNDYIK